MHIECSVLHTEKVDPRSIASNYNPKHNKMPTLLSMRRIIHRTDDEIILVVNRIQSASCSDTIYKHNPSFVSQTHPPNGYTLERKKKKKTGNNGGFHGARHGTLILVVSTISGYASAKAGPRDQFPRLRKCLSNTGFTSSSSHSFVDSRQSIASYGQFTDNVSVNGTNQFSNWYSACRITRRSRIRGHGR